MKYEWSIRVTELLLMKILLILTLHPVCRVPLLWEITSWWPLFLLSPFQTDCFTSNVTYQQVAYGNHFQFPIYTYFKISKQFYRFAHNFFSFHSSNKTALLISLVFLFSKLLIGIKDKKILLNKKCVEY